MAKRTIRRKYRKTTRRRRRGGADTAGVLKRKHEIFFHSKPDDEYRKIVRDLNEDGEFAQKYHAVYDREAIIIKKSDETPRVWIYNVEGAEPKGYLMIDPEDPDGYTQEELNDIASIYDKYLVR